MKRIVKKLAVLLTFIMCLSSIPGIAYAEEVQDERIITSETDTLESATPDSSQGEAVGDRTDLEGGNEETSNREEQSNEEPSVEEQQSETPEIEAQDDPTGDIHVTYRTHVQTYGWQQDVKDGEDSGTTGKSKRLEAISINLENNTGIEGGIQYRTHIQNYGWETGWKEAGQMSGTEGEGKRLEAIQIQLTGALADAYDVYYCFHSQTYGWLNWAKNGQLSGTSGFSKRAEAIKIVLVKKGEAAPETVGTQTSAFVHPLVQYSVHAQTYGWMSTKNDGATAGTTGQSKRLEAIKLSLNTPEIDGYPTDGGIQYETYCQTYGWTGGVKSDGAVGGTTGQSKRLEAVKISLTGTIANSYDVYYRVHVASIGWLDWTCNGERAGSQDYAKAIESIEVKLYPKGQGPAVAGRSCVYKSDMPSVDYTTWVQGTSSYQNYVSNGAQSGTTGQSKRLEAIKIKTSGGSVTSPYSGEIQYRTYMQTTGWQGWKSADQVAGIEKGGKRIEAIEIKLTGELGKYCDVYYQSHVDKYGWLGWAKNGQTSGTSGISYKLQAIKVQIVTKGAAAPGSTSRPYTNQVYDPIGSQIKNACNSIYGSVGSNLYACYMWSVNNIAYRSTPGVGAGYTPSQWYALYGYNNNVGNCYVYAASFYWLAKNLGYDAHYVQGSVPRAGGGMIAHGWVEIIMNGSTYVFDPDFQHETGRNGYQITYGASGTWRYANYGWVN